MNLIAKFATLASRRQEERGYRHPKGFGYMRWFLFLNRDSSSKVHEE
jgi:hypothetical protein